MSDGDGDTGAAGGGDTGADWSWLGAGGPMADAVARTDWTRTALGPPEGWPPSLRTALSICLSSRFPMLVWWGRELVQFYNDAYVPALGDKHPAALGQPAARCWAEAWAELGPLAASVLAGEGATYSQDQLLFMQRHGYTEESYWTFSYSPVRAVDGGAGDVGGIFIAVNDTTERVLGERRLRALRELGEVSGASAGSAEAACRASVDVLARHRTDVPFALAYLREGDGARLVASSGVAPGSSIGPPTLPRPDRGHPIWRALTEPGPALLCSGLAADHPGAIHPAPIGAAVPTDALIVPLVVAGHADPAGALVIGLNPYRELDAEYRAFADLVAHHVTTAVADALAYAAERQRAEALAELDRAKTDFFANVSHEFRTPLTLITGPVEQLRSAPTVAADPQLAAEVDLAHRNGVRLGRLVDTLLDFSRLQAGRARARFEPVDLAATTAELASMFRAATDRAGLVLDVRCPPMDEAVYVDREMWEKVVLNLLSNAVKFTLEGTITVAVRRDGDRAVLEVADTGIGIPEHELERLFERFHRVPGARGRSAEGSGIGLALAAELVRLHGGTLTAGSTVDVGSTFTARIPLGSAHLPPDQVHPARADADQVDGAEPGRPAAEPFVAEAMRWLPDPDGTAAEPPPAAAPARILVADDNADMREYLGRLLAGYAVTAVADGSAALAAARARPPDLVLTDAMMPGMDGFALVAALRAEPRLAGVPVIMVSARAGAESAVDGLAAGADDYLVKPFTAAELTARVRGQLELAAIRRREASRWSALIAALHDGFFVLDDERRIVEVNEAFGAILGYGPEGIPYPQPYPWWPDPDTDPEHRRIVDEVWAGFGSGGQYVVPARHRDGRLVWVSAVYSPVTDPDTGRAGWIATIRDVTADREAARRAERLADEQQRAAGEAFALLADADDVVARHDPDGTWRYVSPAAYRMTGWLPEQLVGRHPLAFVHPEDHDAVEAGLRALAERPAEVLLRFRRADGEYLWTEVRGRLVTDPGTGALELRTVSRDVHARVLAERELERFRAVAEQTTDFVGIAGVDGYAIWVNPAGRRLLGWTPDEDVTRRTITGALTAAAADRLRHEIVPAAQEHGIWAGETEFAGAAGEPIPVSQVFVSHRDHNGQVAYYSSIARDLRPQRAAEQRLQAEQERYRTLVTQVPVGIFLADAGGADLFANDWLRELVGEPTGQAGPLGWLRSVHPADRDGVVASRAAAIGAGERWDRECRLLARDGRTLWLAVTMTPLRDAGGAVTGYLGTAVDVTARRDAERSREQVAAERAARAASEAAAARLNALVSGLAAVVWEGDARTREPTFMSARVEQLLGYSVDRWLGDPRFWPSILHPDDRERAVATVGAALAEGRDYEQTYRLIAADGRVVWVHDVVHVRCDAHGAAQRLQGVLIDVTEQKRAEEAAELLVRVGTVHSRAGSLAERLTSLVEAAAPVLAELAAVVVLGTDGLLRPFVAACPEHPDVLAAALALPPVPLPEPLRDRIGRGRAFVLPGTGEDVLAGVSPGEADLRARLALGLHDRLLVPLLENGRVLGLLSFVSVSRVRHYGPGEMALAEELGRRVTLMIRNDRAAERERRLNEVTAQLAVAATVADAAAALGGAVRRATGASDVVVRAVEPSGHLRRVYGEGAHWGAAGREVLHPRDGDHPAAVVARSGEPLWLGTEEEILARFPDHAGLLEASGYRAGAAVPVRVGERTVAVFVALYPTVREFPAEEREFLLNLAAQSALAFERAALADARRELADTLQRSLLPANLPALDRVALAARYRPAMHGVQAGGDWYDVVALDADRTAIVVGDVVGQGAAAAAVMGQLRSALAGALLLVDGPAAALTHLDRFAARTPGALASTAVCVVLDARTGRLRWATAGHPPPLVVESGKARYLDGDGVNPVLGVGRGAFGEEAVDIAPGATVVLYTDGLVERRAEPIDDGLARLAATADASAAAAPVELVGRILAAVLPDGHNTDDVAVVAARLLPVPLRARLPARPDQLAVVRRGVERWAAEAALPPEQLDDLQLALGEAAANAVEHAYRAAPPEAAPQFGYALERCPDGAVTVEVVDEGTWRPPPADRGHRGRGLDLIRTIGGDTAAVEPAPAGTAVRFAVPAPRPVDGSSADPPPLPDPPAPPGPPTRPDPGPGGAGVQVRVERGGPVVRLHGEVDLAGVAHLRAQILAGLDEPAGNEPAGGERAGPRELVVDLHGVTHLASAGVRLLLDLATEARARAMSVRLVYPAGGPVARVLELTGAAVVMGGGTDAAGPVGRADRDSG